MDRLNRHFLHILRCALKGEQLQTAADLSSEDWAQLMKLSQSHHILPLIFEAVHGLPELQSAPWLPVIRRQVRQQVFVQTQKTCEFLDLYRKFLDAGIRPLVVKGIICRSLYPHPDHRVSSDEDLLIPPELTFSCHQQLCAFGMETAVLPEQFCQVYEIPYRMDNSQLYIELHRHLFPPESEAYGDLNRFFPDVFRQSASVTIQGVPVWTMGCTDHLFYLICHAFKHFLHSGFGIRQVCDIIMFANTCGQNIDWDAILLRCRAIRADRFAAAIFKIGSNHLVFDPQKACYPPSWRDIPVDENPMLEDLLSGGVYGNANLSRRHSSNITLEAVVSQKQGRKAGNSLLLSLFPPAKNLEHKYPYLKSRPYLLPAAWLDRIGKYCFESARDQSGSASDALRIGNQRIALLKEYGIIE